MQTRTRRLQRAALAAGVCLCVLAVACMPTDSGGNMNTSGDNDNAPANTNDNAGGIPRIFPDDYRSTFTLVADCYDQPAHGAAGVKIWVSADAADAYLAGADPLPTGTIIVKEEYALEGCPDEQLSGWAAMLKEEPGFDAEDGDWHWQLVADSEVGVIFNDKSTCIGCHRAESCVSRDYTCFGR